MQNDQTDLHKYPGLEHKCVSKMDRVSLALEFAKICIATDPKVNRSAGFFH